MWPCGARHPKLFNPPGPVSAHPAPAGPQVLVKDTVFADNTADGTSSL